MSVFLGYPPYNIENFIKKTLIDGGNFTQDGTWTYSGLPEGASIRRGITYYSGKNSDHWTVQITMPNSEQQYYEFKKTDDDDDFQTLLENPTSIELKFNVDEDEDEDDPYFELLSKTIITATKVS